MPISRVLSRETPKRSQPAFAFGDVVHVANATDIRSITERPSLPLSSRTRIAVDRPYGFTSPCGERYGLTLFRWSDVNSVGALYTPAVLCAHDGESPNPPCPLQKERQASSAPRYLRRLREFAYVHLAIHPGPAPRWCWQMHRCLATSAPAFRLWDSLSKGFRTVRLAAPPS